VLLNLLVTLFLAERVRRGTYSYRSIYIDSINLAIALVRLVLKRENLRIRRVVNLASEVSGEKS
jgi:hypothetical protein